MITGTVIGALVVVTVLFGEYVGTGVSGEEFNPYTWDQRSFFYRQGLFSGRQIRGITRSQFQSSLGSYVTGQPWCPSSSENRWDLAIDSTVTGDSLDWRAYPLTKLLEYPSFNDYWISWSKQHPTASQHLWLGVMELAQQDQYEAIPLLLDEVMDIESDEVAISTIDSVLKESYREAAKMAGDTQRAAELQRLGEQSLQERLTPALNEATDPQ